MNIDDTGFIKAGVNQILICVHKMLRRDKFPLPICQVYVADGFSTDCEEIVNRCLQLKTLDFKEFSKIWKEMNFDLLYAGRTSSPEIAELSEELIHIAKYYMVKDTSYYEENVTGLFLVYSLIQLQPFSGFACLRLVPKDVRAVNRIETVARRERRLDVLYILGEVLVKCTQYHAEGRQRGMERAMRKYLEGHTSIDMLGVRPTGVFYQQNEELDHIRDLGSMTRQYVLAKKALFSEGINDPSLQYINENLPTELNTSLRKLINGAIEDSDHQENGSSSDEENKTSEDRSRTLQAIKAKAMSNAVDPMKHLTSAENRKKSNTTSTKSKSDLKNPTGKIKSGTRTRLITTSPKKAKTHKIIRRKRKAIGDLDDGADLRVVDVGQITDDEEDYADLHMDTVDDDKNTDNGDKEKEKKKPDNRKQDESVELQNEQRIDIDIESLPLILRPGDFGPDIEIEIIDEQIPKGKKTKPGTTRSPKTTATITSKTPSSDEEEPLSVKAGVSFLKTYKRERKKDIDELTDGFPLKKKEKRDLKRTEVKSRFSKLGLLPVGNFEDKVKKK